MNWKKSTSCDFSTMSLRHMMEDEKHAKARCEGRRGPEKGAAATQNSGEKKKKKKKGTPFVSKGCELF